MLTKIWNALDGWKTHIIAGLGIGVALIGHFWGPISIGPIQIPALSWDDVWKIIWNGGMFSALRAGVASIQSPV